MEKLLEIAAVILNFGISTFLGFFAASCTAFLQTIMGTPNGDSSLSKHVEDDGMILSFLGRFFARKFKEFELAMPDTINPFKPFICEVCGGFWVSLFFSFLTAYFFSFYEIEFCWLVPFATYYFQLKIWKNY